MRGSQRKAGARRPPAEIRRVQAATVPSTFSWFGRNRRLAKDFENLAETLAAFVAIASIQIVIRRLARS